MKAAHRARLPILHTRRVSALDDILAVTTNPDNEWRDKALCAQIDPEMWFPEKGGSTREAKKICQLCEVRMECLAYAMDRDERFGVFGGLSERERRRLKRGDAA
jgi:WhiB family redox-sensing transcriptional regulator